MGIRLRPCVGRENHHTRTRGTRRRGLGDDFGTVVRPRPIVVRESHHRGHGGTRWGELVGPPRRRWSPLANRRQSFTKEERKKESCSTWARFRSAGAAPACSALAQLERFRGARCSLATSYVPKGAKVGTTSTQRECMLMKISSLPLFPSVRFEGVDSTPGEASDPPVRSLSACEVPDSTEGNKGNEGNDRQELAESSSRLCGYGASAQRGQDAELALHRDSAPTTQRGPTQCSTYDEHDSLNR